MCPRGAVLLLLQILLNVDILLAAPSTGFQEEKGSGLESIPQKQLNLQKEFSISLKLSRQLLHKTKNLTQCYPYLGYCIQFCTPQFKEDIAKLEQVQRKATKMLSDRLPGVQVTLISHLGLLPSTSIDLHTWISLPDAKRLSQIAENLSLYQGLVQQLRNFEAMKENSKFTSQFEDVDVILRDLGHQVNYQISLWGLPSKIQPVPTPQILQHHSQWRNRQEVYIVLHSLKSLLVRVARDFLMLRMRVTKRTSFSRTFQSHHSLS